MYGQLMQGWEGVNYKAEIFLILQEQTVRLA